MSRCTVRFKVTEKSCAKCNIERGERLDRAFETRNPRDPADGLSAFQVIRNERERHPANRRTEESADVLVVSFLNVK